MCVASFSTAVLIKARLAGIGSLSIPNEETDPTNRTRDLTARGFKGFGCAKVEVRKSFRPWKRMEGKRGK